MKLLRAMLAYLSADRIMDVRISVISERQDASDGIGCPGPGQKLGSERSSRP